ncbi:MAG: hypothetical protein HY831_02520 [Candidatus Aenigmarchaeota archaeon]|nr:hypothetical protein [Candidatus Aenigmarchaeota archaeon]
MIGDKIRINGLFSYEEIKNILTKLKSLTNSDRWELHSTLTDGETSDGIYTNRSDVTGEMYRNGIPISIIGVTSQEKVADNPQYRELKFSAERPVNGRAKETTDYLVELNKALGVLNLHYETEED